MIVAKLVGYTLVEIQFLENWAMLAHLVSGTLILALVCLGFLFFFLFVF